MQTSKFAVLIVLQALSMSCGKFQANTAGEGVGLAEPAVSKTPLSVASLRRITLRGFSGWTFKAGTNLNAATPKITCGAERLGRTQDGKASYLPQGNPVPVDAKGSYTIVVPGPGFYRLSCIQQGVALPSAKIKQIAHRVMIHAVLPVKKTPGSAVKPTSKKMLSLSLGFALDGSDMDDQPLNVVDMTPQTTGAAIIVGGQVDSGADSEADQIDLVSAMKMGKLYSARLADDASTDDPTLGKKLGMAIEQQVRSLAAKTSAPLDLNCGNDIFAGLAPSGMRLDHPVANPLVAIAQADQAMAGQQLPSGLALSDLTNLDIEAAKLLPSDLREDALRYVAKQDALSNILDKLGVSIGDASISENLVSVIDAAIQTDMASQDADAAAAHSEDDFIGDDSATGHLVNSLQQSTQTDRSLLATVAMTEVGMLVRSLPSGGQRSFAALVIGEQTSAVAAADQAPPASADVIQKVVDDSLSGCVASIASDASALADNASVSCDSAATAVVDAG